MSLLEALSWVWVTAFLNTVLLQFLLQRYCLMGILVNEKCIDGVNWMYSWNLSQLGRDLLARYGRILKV
jgi:hypothetical protein